MAKYVLFPRKTQQPPIVTPGPNPEDPPVVTPAPAPDDKVGPIIIMDLDTAPVVASVPIDNDNAKLVKLAGKKIKHSQIPKIEANRLVVTQDGIDYWFSDTTPFYSIGNMPFPLKDIRAYPDKYVIGNGAITVDPAWVEPTIDIPADIGKDDNGLHLGQNKNA